MNEKTKNLILEIPKRAGCKNAERIGQAGVLQYEYELANPDGVFARNDIDLANPENRYFTYFCLLENSGGSQSIVRAGEILLMLNGKDGDLDKLQDEYEALNVLEFEDILKPNEAIEGTWG